MLEDLVNIIIAFAFLFLALGTLGLIFGDVFRHLNSDDQITLRRSARRMEEFRNFFPTKNRG